MLRVTFSGHVPPVLISKRAVFAFARLFGTSYRDSKRALIRLSVRTRIVLRPETPRGIFALVPDDADIVLIARELPGVAPLAITGVQVGEAGDEEDEWNEERKAA